MMYSGSRCYFDIPRFELDPLRLAYLLHPAQTGLHLPKSMRS